MQTQTETLARCYRPTTTAAQPLAVLQLPGGLLKIDTVRAITGLSTATVYRMMAAGRFPRALKVGAAAVRWSSDDIRQWMNDLRHAA